MEQELMKFSTLSQSQLVWNHSRLRGSWIFLETKDYD